YDVERSSDGDDFEINHDVKFGVSEPVKVPDGQYFVLGDSRDNSRDSRYWGFVPRENIFARALYVHLSFDQRADGLTNKLTSIRWRRLGTAAKGEGATVSGTACPLCSRLNFIRKYGQEDFFFRNRNLRLRVCADRLFRLFIRAQRANARAGRRTFET